VYKTPLDLTSQFYRPLVNIWIERMSAARTAKGRFTKVAEQCTEFYEAGAGFMWEEKFKRDYFAGKLPSPKFKITIAKLYEFVAIYGPHLFWQYARRKVITQRQMVLRPEMFGDPNDPTVQEVFAQVLQQDTIEQAMSSFANEMMGNYLDWSQREQPSGLSINGQMAVTEALVKGMGCLWPDVYSFPGSDQKFTRLRFKTVNNLFIDPDCKDPMLETAGYIALRHVNPIWQVEKKFKLPKGTLAGKGNISSMEQISRNNQKKQPGESGKGTHDQIEWWEIWSKCGVGPRAAAMSHQMIDEFDEQIGDYAYLCVANGVPFPLNATPDKFFGENAATPEDVKAMFEWRFADYGEHFPIWGDAKWPVSLLSFNKLPNTPWPLAPAAPGLGELIAINILTSSYVDQAWSDRKSIIGYLKSALGDVKQALESENAIELVAINDNVQKSISDCIQYLNTPGRANNLLEAIEMLSQNFDKRVGLSELQYGMSSTQIRVASDVRTRMESANIRPEKMSKDVAAWMSEAAQMEMFSAIMYVEGKSLTHLLGGYGASQWDSLIKSMPIEQAMREMKATVEASEVRRPNHERDTANVQALQQYITPLLQQYAMTTGDTKQLNDFFDMIGESMEMPAIARLKLGPWSPPTDEQTQQLMQAAQQAEVENVQSDSAQKQAAAKKLEAEAVATIAEMGAEGEGEGANAATDKANEVIVEEVKFRQSLNHKQQEHDQKMISNQELLVQKLLFNEAEATLKQKSMQEQGAIKNAQAKRKSAIQSKSKA
jgi:hypothetical protein